MNEDDNAPDQAYFQGVIDLMNALRRPANVQTIAEVALALRCNMVQAHGIATMYSFLLATWVANWAGPGEAGRVIQRHGEPDWAELARKAGEPFDVEHWETESRRLIEDWSMRHSGQVHVVDGPLRPVANRET